MQDPRSPQKRAALKAQMNRLDAVMRGKAKLIRLGRRSGVMRCPCGAEGKTLRLVLAGRKNHVHAGCSACGYALME